MKGAAEIIIHNAILKMLIPRAGMVSQSILSNWKIHNIPETVYEIFTNVSRHTDGAILSLKYVNDFLKSSISYKKKYCNMFL